MNSVFYDEMDNRFGAVRTKQYKPSRYLYQLKNKFELLKTTH